MKKNPLLPLLLFTLPLTAQEEAPKPQTQADFYTREEIPTPPGAVFEASSIAIMPDQKVAVATRRGELWIVEGAYADDLSKVKWTLFASGLHEPLGMFYKDGSLFLTQRPEVSRLTDNNGDLRADKFETVGAGWGINGDYHEYAFGSDPDANGDVWVVLCLTGSGKAASDWRGWCMRVTPDGKTIPTASGIRSPGGIGMNATGDMFYTDNQGLWNGSSSLKWLKPGSFQGNPTGNKYHTLAGLPAPPEPESGSRVLAEHLKYPTYIPPAVVFPHGIVGNSPTAIIPDSTEGKFGPFAGQVLVGEQTKSQVQRVYLEKINGFYQGAVWHLLEGFRSGIVPMRMGDEATLFVGGTNRGWAALGGKNYTFERVRWNGKTPFEMHEVHSRPDGFEVTFTEEIDPRTATELSAYQIKTWTYILQKGYGSPQVDSTEPTIEKVTVGADNRSIRLKIKGLVRGHVHHLNLEGLKSAQGQTLWHPDVYYTLNEIPKN